MNDDDLGRLSKLRRAFENYEDTCRGENISCGDSVACQQKATSVLGRLGTDYNIRDLDVLKTFSIVSSEYFGSFYEAARSAKLISAL